MHHDQEQRLSDTEGVVTNMTHEEGPAGHVEARNDAGDTTAEPTAGPLQVDIGEGRSLEEEELLPAPTTATASGSGGPTAVDRPADARTGGNSYVVNAGGDPKTYRVIDYDEDDNTIGVRLGRVIVREDGSLALHELKPQAPGRLNAQEIALLERRLEELREGRNR